MEALTNIVKYSYKMDERGTIVVRLTLQENSLAISIQDSGVGMSEARFARSGASVEFDPAVTSELPECGMGIAIIKGVMDRVSYRQTEQFNILYLEKLWDIP